LLNELETTSIGEHQAIGQIVKRIRIGNLFDCVGIWSTREADRYEALSDAAVKRKLEGQIDDMAVELGANPLRCCIHFILDNKKTCRAVSMFDIGTGDDRVIGYDDTIVLMGLFITNSRAEGIGLRDKQLYERAMRQVLLEVGVESLSEVDNPLAERTYVQESLFSE